MSLARRLGLTDVTGYVPAAFAVTAFALGVQGALVFEALTGSGYPPVGRAGLAWTSLIVLVASAVLHVPPDRALSAFETVWNPIASIGARRSVVLEPHPDGPGHHLDATPEAAGGTNGAGRVQRLSARVHSPLAAGPAVAPHETLPVTVEAEPEELAREITVTFEVHGPAKTRTLHREMRDTRLVEGLEFAGSGGFEVHVEIDHPDAEPVSQTLTGTVTTYREEIGHLFETLKERLAEDGLDVGPQSTPREVCEELGRVDAAEPDTLAELAVELEVALYGDDEIQRATYETVYTTLRSLDAPTPEEVPG